MPTKTRGSAENVHPNYVDIHTEASHPDNRRQHQKVLFISDSMLKHVDNGKVFPNTMKRCFPGALCPRLLSEIVTLNQKYVFDEVIVYVGTNYLQNIRTQVNTEAISTEISDFLTATRDLLPSSTTITFSSILPKISDDLLPAIDRINAIIFNLYSELPYMDFVWYPVFQKSSKGSIVTKLISWDGVHLNYRGVNEIEKRLREYLVCRYKYLLTLT